MSAIDDSPLHFRFAIDADVEAIVALTQAAYRGDESRKGWTTEADFLDDQRISAREVAALIADPETRVVLGERRGELIALAKLIRQGERCFFGLFSVRPTLQGEGIGKRLLAECERLAQAELGCRQMRMQVISIREELLAYYERRGYRRTGELEPFPYENMRPGGARRLDLCFEVLVKELPSAAGVPG